VETVQRQRKTSTRIFLSQKTGGGGDNKGATRHALKGGNGSWIKAKPQAKSMEQRFTPSRGGKTAVPLKRARALHPQGWVEAEGREGLRGKTKKKKKRGEVDARVTACKQEVHGGGGLGGRRKFLRGVSR